MVYRIERLLFFKYPIAFNLSFVLIINRLMIDTNALFVPFVEAMDAFVNFYLMMPSKLVEFAYIREFFQRAIGL